MHSFFTATLLLISNAVFAAPSAPAAVKLPEFIRCQAYIDGQFWTVVVATGTLRLDGVSYSYPTEVIAFEEKNMAPIHWVLDKLPLSLQEIAEINKTAKIYAASDTVSVEFNLPKTDLTTGVSVATKQTIYTSPQASVPSKLWVEEDGKPATHYDFGCSQY